MPDSAFGPDIPGRPTHPDFGRLVETVLWFDGEATEGTRSFTDIIGEFGFDSYSAAYMAQQRVMRAREHEVPAWTIGAALWLEAFMIGLRIARAEPAINSPAHQRVVDECIAEAHRNLEASDANTAADIAADIKARLEVAFLGYDALTHAPPDRADCTAFRYTYADLDSIAGRELTNHEVEQIVRAMDNSSMGESVIAAIEQVTE